MLDQDNNLYLISLNILITCLLDNVRILLGEVSCWSLLGIKGLSRLNLYKFCTTGIQGLTKGYFLQCKVFLVNNFFFNTLTMKYGSSHIKNRNSSRKWNNKFIMSSPNGEETWAVKWTAYAQHNPLHPNISINILHTVLSTFPKVITRRICLTIRSFFCQWSFPLFSWP